MVEKDDNVDDIRTRLLQIKQTCLKSKPHENMSKYERSVVNRIGH